MRELSLNILDVVGNSISAGAKKVNISIREDTKAKTLYIAITDNGCGMTREQASNVTDPFYTTRTTRKVGMGIPFFKLSAEQTGGSFKINSRLGEGTSVEAFYKTDSLDFTPLGDITSTLITLITMNENTEFLYNHTIDQKEFVFSTIEIKKMLDDVPLSESSVKNWLTEYIDENEKNIGK